MFLAICALTQGSHAAREGTVSEGQQRDAEVDAHQAREVLGVLPEKTDPHASAYKSEALGLLSETDAKEAMRKAKAKSAGA